MTDAASNSVTAAPIPAADFDAEDALAQLKVNTALSLERVPIGFNRVALRFIDFVHVPLQRRFAPLHNMRRSLGSKANASRFALFWHSEGKLRPTWRRASATVLNA